MSFNTAGAKELFQHSRSALQKHTAQADIILRTFLESVEGGERLSVEELHRLVKHKDPRIGASAVYRTLKLLADCGVAHELEPPASEGKRADADRSNRMESHQVHHARS